MSETAWQCPDSYSGRSIWSTVKPPELINDAGMGERGDAPEEKEAPMRFFHELHSSFAFGERADDALLASSAEI
jgi:hypothetical protein